ncbi:uncharacterized protein LOC144663633 [Oculina patagonica]
MCSCSKAGDTLKGVNLNIRIFGILQHYKGRVILTSSILVHVHVRCTSDVITVANMFAIDVIDIVSCCNPYSVVCIAVILAAVILFLDKFSSRSSILISEENEEIQQSTYHGRLSRPVGPLEKGLINAVDKRHIPKVVVLLRITSRVHLDPDMVRQALVLLAKRYPLLRMKINKESRNGGPVSEYFTEVDSSEINFKATKDFNAGDLEPVFEREFETPFDLNFGPLWRAILLDEIHVDGAKNGYKNAIVFTFLHVIADGRSILLMLEQFFRYITLLYKGQVVQVESMQFRPSTGFLMGHRCTPSVLDKVVLSMSSWVSRLKAVLKIPRPENLYLTTYPPVFTRDPEAPDRTSVVYREHSLEETQELIKACKMSKCSVHGAITAASHIAMAKILHEGRDKTSHEPVYIKSSCNIDIRKECWPEIESNEFVLCVSSLRTEIKVSPKNNDFWKFAQECTRQVKWAFFTGQHHKFLKHCYLKLTAAEKQKEAPPIQQDLRIFNLSNLGRQEWKAAENGPFCFDGLSGSVTLRPSGLVFGFLCATINGRLYYTNSYNKRVVSREQAVGFLDLTLDILMDACELISRS